MKAFIALLASACPPLAQACLTSSVLNSARAHAAGAAGASSADAEKVTNVNTPTMDMMLTNNPSFDMDGDPCVGTVFDEAARRLFSRAHRPRILNQLEIDRNSDVRSRGELPRALYVVRGGENCRAGSRGSRALFTALIAQTACAPVR